jgi:hypothetical protein
MTISLVHEYLFRCVLTVRKDYFSRYVYDLDLLASSSNIYFYFYF